METINGVSIMEHSGSIESKLRGFVERMPKAELHLHFDSINPDVLIKVAKRNGLNLPYGTHAEALKWHNFKDLEEFLGKWLQTVEVMLTEEDYFEAAYDLGKDMERQNILRREAMFTYQAVHEHRVPLEVMMTGLARARKAIKEDFNRDLYFIADIDRTRSPESGINLVKSILPYSKSVGIIGVGFDCQEVGYPATPHKEAFKLARENGFFLSAHCGEEYASGPAGVWDIITNMNPDRIDHGNQSIRDEKLVQYLVETQIPLTLCPMSNVGIKVYNDISEHPAIPLRDKGAFVTINSDDPPFMKNDLVDNFCKLTKSFNLSNTELCDLARNSFIASYASDDQKQQYLKILDEWILSEIGSK